MKKTAHLLLLLPALLLAACSLLDGGGNTIVSDLERHRRQWQRQGFDTYEYDLTVGCFCVFRGPAHVTVRADTVFSVIAVATGAPVDPNFRFAYQTIDDLFDVIEEARKRPADRLEVTYDETLGFPSFLYIDYDFGLADEEISYEAANVHPLR